MKEQSGWVLAQAVRAQDPSAFQVLSGTMSILHLPQVPALCLLSDASQLCLDTAWGNVGTGRCPLRQEAAH